MDLVIWRHAEAEDEREGQDDLRRSLTHRGEKQAARMAAWLDRQLPDTAKIFCSPARRCEQTVLPLGRKYKVRDELAPDRPIDPVLELAQWPAARHTVLLVGHQPMLGNTIARLLGLAGEESQVRKGAIWWLRARERDGVLQTVVVTVQSPDTL